MNIFQAAAARLLSKTAVVECEVDMTLEVEFAPALTLAEITRGIADEIGTRGLLQELA